MNPTFIMMVGLPYSGKSYYAEKLLQRVRCCDPFQRRN